MLSFKSVKKACQDFWHDKIRVEVTIRITLICLGSYALAIADIPEVVPPSLSLILGIVGIVLALGFPKLLFAIAAIIPAVYCAIIFSLVAGTMLLACVVKSDGLLVGIFTIYTLIMMTLYGGKSYDKTSGYASMLNVLPALIALSYRPAVQEYGMEFVTGMWTESGTDNPLAVSRNLLIVISWGFAIWAVVISLPPFQTARKTITRTLLPAIFGQVNSFVTTNGGNPAPLIHFWHTLGGGAIAKMTLMEPRIFTSPRTSLTQDLVTPLQEMLVLVDHLILNALVFSECKEQETVPTPVLQETTALLKLCGSALASDEPTELQAWKESIPTEPRTDTLAKDAEYHLYLGAVSLRLSILAWLDAMKNPKQHTQTEASKQKVKQLATTVLPCCSLPMLLFQRITSALLLPFTRPSTWSWFEILWTVKISAGYVALFCMVVYWDGYANFRIEPSDDVGAVYYGWNMLGFAYAWRQTREATFKKGLQRCLGTCLGAFMAWLGVIVCAWSYDDDAEINPYGFVAWLTIFTVLGFVATALDPNLGALMGMSKDLGYTGMYYGMTLCLIALEIYPDAGSKNGLTVNRMVATLSGVVMAIILSTIPPFVDGGDPQHARDYLTEMSKAFDGLLQAFVNVEKSTEFKAKDFETKLMGPTRESGRRAFFLLKDCSIMLGLPIFKVNPKLMPLLEHMATTASFIGHLQEIMAKELDGEESEVAAARRCIQEILDGNDEIDNDAGISVSGALFIQNKLKDHKLALTQLSSPSGEHETENDTKTETIVPQRNVSGFWANSKSFIATEAKV